MQNYEKHATIEQQLERSDLPFADCLPAQATDFSWMHVKKNSHVEHLLEAAKEALKSQRFIVWSGIGDGATKTVSCVEILKRSYRLHQVTRITETTTEDHWKAKTGELLDDLVAKRSVPCLHILTSLDALPENVIDVQKPTHTPVIETNCRGSRTDADEDSGDDLQRQMPEAFN